MMNSQDWVLKQSNVVGSPITNDTLLVKDEETDKIFIRLYI